MLGWINKIVRQGSFLRKLSHLSKVIGLVIPSDPSVIIIDRQISPARRVWTRTEELT